MKKVITLVVMMTFACVSSMQAVTWWNKGKDPLRYQTSLGLGATSVGPGDEDFGWGVTVTADYPIVNSLRLQPGVRFATYHSTYEENMSLMGSGINRKDKFTVSYLQIPMKVAYSLYFNEKVRFNVSTGFYYAMDLFGSLKVDVDGDSGITGGGDMKLWDCIDRSDFGYILGWSLTIKDRYSLGVEVCNSFFDVSKSGDADWHNSSLMVQLGYTF